MHEKRFKIDFFANFRKLQKKLPICKKRYAEILNVFRTVVRNVEKKVKSTFRIFFTSAKVAPDCNITASTFQKFGAIRPVISDLKCFHFFSEQGF